MSMVNIAWPLKYIWNYKKWNPSQQVSYWNAVMLFYTFHISSCFKSLQKSFLHRWLIPMLASSRTTTVPLVFPSLCGCSVPPFPQAFPHRSKPDILLSSFLKIFMFYQINMCILFQFKSSNIGTITIKSSPLPHICPAKSCFTLTNDLTAHFWIIKTELQKKWYI